MWRARLDSTTNWSVVSTAAALTVSFSEPRSGPVLLALATLMITLFLWIEARRYRYFELWSLRVRLLERKYFVPLLEQESEEALDRQWRQDLADTLKTQTFPISISEAFGRRYRSVYIWLQGVLAMSWLVHVWRFPEPAEHWSQLWKRSMVGQITLDWALFVGVVFQISLLAVGILTSRMREAHGEVL